MKNHRFKVAVLFAVLSTGALLGAAGLQAAEVDDVLKAGAAKVEAEKSSQKRIDQTADQTYDLLQKFKTVNKQIEGLKVYNAQLERQIANQESTMADLRESIENATVMERQIIPLIAKMIDSLEQFVKLDMPFDIEERLASIERQQENLERSDLSTSEKFRQILELYKIESEYGRKIETYEDTVDIDGRPREVNILRVGRIALLYQTTDQKVTGAWNNRARQWEVLDSGDYRSAVANGIRIAKKQATIDIMQLPILAPEAVQ